MRLIIFHNIAPASLIDVRIQNNRRELLWSFADGIDDGAGKEIFAMIMILMVTSMMQTPVKKSPVAGCVGFWDDPDDPGCGRPPVSPWLEGTVTFLS